MIRIGKWSSLAAMVCLAAALSGCGVVDEPAVQEQGQVEGLEELGNIQVITREEGSGTRNAFAEMAGFQKNEEGKTDLTTDAAKTAYGSEEVINAVAEDHAAIGYSSLGTLDSSKKVKILEVNGIEASLAKKAYPLSRTFYVAYIGKLSELEQDFLMYIHGAGQEYVGKNYLPVAKSSSFLSNKSAGKITIGGSTSVAPLMEELAKHYMALNPNAEIIVQATDSTDGLSGAMSGSYDLGMSSRDLKDYEKELLDYEAIAQDYIAVIVNEENPLEDITLDQLKRIYTGDLSRWRDLNQ